jgi:ribosomal protein L34
MTTHYPKRTSNIKRSRLMGFRARMKTKSGRKIINGKRRRGQMLNAAQR